MTIIRTATLLAFSSLVLGAPLAASARPLARQPYYEEQTAPEGVQPDLVQADGRACVKQCPEDLLPCDPPSFKQADGRCFIGNR